MRDHIAYVECQEIHCPLTDTFSEKYNAASTGIEEKRLLYTTNPNKTRICCTLIGKHLAEGRKVMVFCDNLFGLEMYTQLLKRPKIDGKTPTEERERILRKFRTRGQDRIDCVMFSKVGDHSIDLPEADVVIQVALMDGSRMQEGQRIGRIQRPAPNKNRAYFYSLVSNDTEEVNYAKWRREFLEQLGYSVAVDEDYAKWLGGQDTINLISASVQGMLLSAVANELENRKFEKEEKARPYLGFHNVRAGKFAGMKRKKTSVREDLRKKLKKDNTTM